MNVRSERFNRSERLGIALIIVSCIALGIQLANVASARADGGHSTKVYLDDGGDRIVIDDGGVLHINSDGVISTDAQALVCDAGAGDLATAAVSAGVTVAEYGDGVTHKTVFTLTAAAMTITDANSNGAHGVIKLYEGPAGYVEFEGATMNLAIHCGSTGFSESATYDWGVGSTTVGTDNNALATTEQNILTKAEGDLSSGSKTITQVATTDVALDGTSTAVDLFLNSAWEGNDVTASDSCTITGTITVIWRNLGDY
jgi:hypothetical protein